MDSRRFVLILAASASFLLAGCGTLGIGSSDPTSVLSTAYEPALDPNEKRDPKVWELRRNPKYLESERYQSEPKYIWVRKDLPGYRDLPTLNRIIFGKDADLAPQEKERKAKGTGEQAPTLE